MSRSKDDKKEDRKLQIMLAIIGAITTLVVALLANLSNLKEILTPLPTSQPTIIATSTSPLDTPALTPTSLTTTQPINPTETTDPLSLTPTLTANAHYDQGELAYEDYDFELAITEFIQAIDQNYEPLAQAYDQLGWSYYSYYFDPEGDENTLDMAIASFFKALSEDPSYIGDVQLGLGWTHFHKGKLYEGNDAQVLFESAIGHFNTALSQGSPYLGSIYEGLGWSYYRKAREIAIDEEARLLFEESFTAFEKALENEKTTTSVYDGLGWSSFRLGNYFDAIKYFNIALEIDQDYITSQDGLARIENEIGNINTFNEDFTVGSKYWACPDNVSWIASCSVTNNAFQWQLTGTGSVYAFIASDIPSMSDFDLEVALNPIEYSSTPTYGVWFRGNDNIGAYFFEIDSTGKYQITKYTNQDKFTNIVGWREEPVINQNSENKLRITAMGSKIRLFINDKLVSEFTDYSFSTGKLKIVAVMSQDRTLTLDITDFKLTVLSP